MRAITIGLMIAILSYSGLMHAQAPCYLHLINHIHQDLNFLITHHPEVAQDFPSSFVLHDQAKISSRLITQDETRVYIRATMDHEKSTAFFSAGIANGHTQISGYIGNGIAYSWRTDTIVFCTPEEFHEKNTCFR